MHFPCHDVWFWPGLYTGIPHPTMGCGHIKLSVIMRHWAVRHVLHGHAPPASNAQAHARLPGKDASQRVRLPPAIAPGAPLVLTHNLAACVVVVANHAHETVP